MNIHTCERCGQQFEYAGNAKRCPVCRYICERCGGPVKNFNRLCDQCRYKAGQLKRRMVKCKHPDCETLIRYDKHRHGYCREHTDYSKAKQHFTEYNKKYKKVIEGSRAIDLGLRTENIPHILTICDVCQSVYLATPGALRRGGAHCCSPECVGINAVKKTPKKDTAIEQAIEQALIEREWQYQKQVPLAGICVADFYLPDFQSVIFCDGEFWHRDPASIKRDARQNEVLTQRGYAVYRFPEPDIKQSPHNCLDQITLPTRPVPRQLRLPIFES